MITADDLRAEELRLRYRALLADSSVYPTRANWDFIISHRMEGIGHLLLDKYIAASETDDVDRDELHNIAVEEFPRYLAAVYLPYALQVVYGNISRPDITAALIRRLGLFDADYLIDIFDTDMRLVLDVLDVYQPEYGPEHLTSMRRLLSLIDALPRRGRLEERRGLLGTSHKYICPQGHVNDAAAAYCTHAGCGQDICGLTAGQRSAVEIFRHRTEALESLLEG